MKTKGWGATILGAWILVSVVVIALACFRGCEDKKEETEPEVAPIMKTVEITPKQDDREPWEDEMLAEIEAQMQPPERRYIGKCRLTVYNATENSYGYQTATGIKSQHLMTCAVDPAVIPYGSVVIVIDKDGEEHRFRAVDCGGFSGKWVDVFFDDSEAHGIQWLDECFDGEFAEVYVEVAR